MPRPSGAGVGILGLGMGLPEQVRGNDFWSEQALAEHRQRAPTDFIAHVDFRTLELDPEVSRLSAGSRRDPFRGTRFRRIAEEGTSSSELELRAARAALEAAAVEPDAIDLLLVYTLLPDTPAPLNHGTLAAQLRLRADVQAMSVATGCASFITHLALASRLIRSGAYRRALIVQSALTSPIIDPLDPASIHCGDAAAAAVLGPVEPGLGFVGEHQITQGELSGAIRLVPPSTQRDASGREYPPWYRGDLHGQRLFATVTDPLAGILPAAKTASYCRQCCAPLLDRFEVRPDEVDLVVASQPAHWYGAACAEALSIDPARVHQTFEDYAHVMVCSVPLNLWDAHRRGRIEQGDLVLLYASGAGFVQVGALYRWAAP